MRIKNIVISALMGVIIIFFAFAVSWVAENVQILSVYREAILL